MCPELGAVRNYPHLPYSSEPQKAHLTGEFVIVAKFGGHVLHHLASGLANVIRQGGSLA